MKTKDCSLCFKAATTLYRVQIKVGKEWIFVCPLCITQAQSLPNYRYGGTWQGSRH